MSSPLLILGHAADRTGPPIYLLNLLRWVREHRPGMDIEIAVPVGGELLDDLRALAPVTVLAPLDEGISDDDRDLLLQGAVGEPAWWAWRREVLLREMMERFADREVVYVNGAPAIELAEALPPGPRVLLSHVHELEIGLVHHMTPEGRRCFLEGAARHFSVARAVTDNLVDRHGVDACSVELHPGMVDVDAIVGSSDAAHRADVRRSHQIDPDHHVVGACGTIGFRKGTDLFLRMAWHLTRTELTRPVTFVWVGGDEGGIARAEARAEELGLSDVVRFVGVQPDPTTWFGLMDVFVLPSREDPFPLVCIEAAAVGTPIVAFDTGGIPDLLTQGCGDVVTYPDVRQLAVSVREMLEDDQWREALGQWGVEVARSQYDIGVLAPRVWDSIEQWM